MRTLSVKALDRVMVVALGAQNPTDAEWDETVAVGRQLLEAAGRDASRTGGIVFTDGGSPSSRQRQKARELYGEKPPSLALVTDSVVARGAAAIFSLFWPSGNAVFSSSDWEKALRHAGITPSQDAEAVRLLQSMQREVGELGVLKALLAAKR
ncbi:MAG: hypothetical protein Q8L48_13435 [Archangium sp.]|nr:hypothetical protein [Archangium sp.]